MVRPRSVAAFLVGHESEREFCRIIHAILPHVEAEIWHADGHGLSREQARVRLFQRHVEAEHFPIYEVEEYDQVVWGIPFVRNGWPYEAFHDLDRRPGETLLLALSALPLGRDEGARVALLDAAATYVSRDDLARIPPGGFPPTALHACFDGTSCVAVAEFADWLWGETDTVFLDLDDEIEVLHAEWTRENVLDLAAQWQRALAILGRIDDLVAWLETDPTPRFGQLLDAGLGCDARLIYERTRRLYACEITEEGLVVIPDDEPAHVALPLGAPA